MRIDIVSVFPQYFAPLELSLFGKARAKGLLEVHTHDLRDWTHDVHHSVDDTPVGGGAGMVMKPSVWAECLDELLDLPPEDVTDATAAVPGIGRPADDAVPAAPGIPADADVSPTPDTPSVAADNATTADDAAVTTDDITDTTPDDATAAPDAAAPDAPATAPTLPGVTLILPNPSAPLFTQRDANELSHADHLVFGCGRYEGYDARIPEYYRLRGVDVREYSIGDYVLNGGEAATLVMLEAITRLIPGFMGNPDSLVEESYTGDALLEHRQYTKPAEWRGLKVPDVLLSGDHGRVDRFRRDEALARTDRIRPDLIERLDCRALDKADRKTLIALGWEVSGAHPRRMPASGQSSARSR